jgi:hypothetical protein
MYVCFIIGIIIAVLVALIMVRAHSRNSSSSTSFHEHMWIRDDENRPYPQRCATCGLIRRGVRDDVTPEQAGENYPISWPP